MNERKRRYLKKWIAIRADGRCEYCRVLEYLSLYEFHLEHIISKKHGGSSLPENLAYACSWCNWKKGPNIATVLYPEGELIRLFNPRVQNWFDHFEADSSGLLIGKSPIGQATIKLLELNDQERIKERMEMIISGCYP
ncbi:MAG: hypothetical protein KIPDCIKN_02176 [Haliscomenobacter sp.]|nr:hypothetical protein [Haliscomenobacter sp.]